MVFMFPSRTGAQRAGTKNADTPTTATAVNINLSFTCDLEILYILLDSTKLAKLIH